MGKVFAIVNQKGGVGKTTTAINLATALVATGKKILLIDSDPQGNATSSFGIEITDDRETLYNVLINSLEAKQAIYKTEIPNLDIIVSSMDLAAAEIELINLPNCRSYLKDRLDVIVHNYDYIFIDCPPSLGLLTINALVVSSGIIIPLQCEFFALEGLNHLIKTFKMVRDNLNNNLNIHGIILTMYDRRNNLTTLVEEDVRKCLGNLVYNNIIPRNVKLAEATSHGKPALIYDMHCVGSVAYMEIAKEFLYKESQLEQTI